METGLTEFRADIHERLEQGLEMAVVDAFASNMRALTSYYTHTQSPQLIDDDLEHYLHDAWYTCIQVAKSIDFLDHPNLHHVIVCELLAVKTLGPLQPQMDETASILKRWCGLPLFAQDLTGEFTSRYYSRGLYKENQQENFASFIGRLLSVGIYDGPALCALSIFRETLEVPRPIILDPDLNSEQISLGHLFKALAALVGATGYSLPILASHHWAAFTTSGSDQNLASLGELAIQAGNIPLSGYSPERWRFWMQRLAELSQCEVQDIADDAESIMDELKAKQGRAALFE